MPTERTLSELRAEFGRSRFLAMPIAGTIAWAVAAFFGSRLESGSAAIALFLCTAAIFPLGLLIARFTGEDLLGSTGNELDRLFGLNVLMANLAWGIVIPFWMTDPSSLPLGAGILAGLMWVPFSWMIQHWVGLFHAIVRTVLVAGVWLLFPSARFVAVPLVVVAVYLATIAVLMNRPSRSPLSVARCP